MLVILSRAERAPPPTRTLRYSEEQSSRRIFARERLSHNINNLCQKMACPLALFTPRALLVTMLV